MFYTAVYAFIAALLVTVMGCVIHINICRRKQLGQYIREDGPDGHEKKAGTPTMGGAVFITVSIIVGLLLIGPAKDAMVIYFVILACGTIGFIDDYIKIFKNRSLGLKARSKLAGLVLITAGIIIMLHYFGLYSTELLLPVVNRVFDIGVLYPLFLLLLLTGFSNSVNLTDGLDGLAAGVSALSIMAYVFIGLWSNQDSIVIISVILVAALVGFLFYNRYPAKLFMGDTGSLSLGGALTALAVVTKTELFLVIIGGVFFIEALSVIIQVISFKTTGKRIFLMSPLHHHFEKKGWSEQMIVIMFWFLTLVLAIVGLYAYNRAIQ